MQLRNAGVAQLVEHQPSKLRVAGSSLVARSFYESLIRSGFTSPEEESGKTPEGANVAQG